MLEAPGFEGSVAGPFHGDQAAAHVEYDGVDEEGEGDDGEGDDIGELLVLTVHRGGEVEAGEPEEEDCSSAHAPVG